MRNSLYIECGKIVNTHGCHGGVKIESWCNSPEDLTEIDTLYFKRGDDFIAIGVVKASVFKQFVVATLDGINDMDAAMALKGTVVFARRDSFRLAEGEYFIADLYGLNVIDADNGRVYGTLKDVVNRGASDIYVVDTPAGERMMPVVDEFVDRVDITKGIFVRPIDGMLD